jgi:hypothetical protein
MLSAILAGGLSERSGNHHVRVGNCMEEIEVAVNPVGGEEQLAALIEEAADHYGLQVRMRGTLHLSRLPALAFP